MMMKGKAKPSALLIAGCAFLLLASG